MSDVLPGSHLRHVREASREAFWDVRLLVAEPAGDVLDHPEVALPCREGGLEGSPFVRDRHEGDRVELGVTGRGLLEWALRPT